MSEFIRWRDEWTLRIEILDEDHRALAEMLNRIAASFEPRQRQTTSESRASPLIQLQPTVFALLGEFGRRAREHFRREEAFMREIDYPGLAYHKAEHGLLTAEYAQLMRKLHERRTPQLERAAFQGLQRWLKDWLIGHVLDSDRRLAVFYYELCGVKQKESW
jgi:hemerythrin-like metal-binding protein